MRASIVRITNPRARLETGRLPVIETGLAWLPHPQPDGEIGMSISDRNRHWDKDRIHPIPELVFLLHQPILRQESDPSTKRHQDPILTQVVGPPDNVQA